MKTRPMLVLVGALFALSGCPKAEPTPRAEPKAEAPADPGVVKLSAEGQKQAGVKVEPASTRPLAVTLTATGEFDANGDKEAHVSPRVAGRVVRILKTVGDRVRLGEPLAVLESLDLGKAEAEFLEAQARVELGRSTFSRQSQLFKSDLTAKKELLSAENGLRLHEIELERVRNQLKLFGLGEARLAELAKSRRIDPLLPLTAPIGGVVIGKHLTMGEALAPDAAEPAFVLSDTSELWVNANLYEKDLAKVHEGQSAMVSTPAYSGRTYRGRVSLISTSMDKDTRTAQARVVVANADGRLKPEMFATVAIRLGEARSVVVPQSAVLREKAQIFAFVKKGEEAFEKRAIKVGTPTGGLQPVLEGLREGEPVVVDGGITLKAELLKGSFGDED